MDVTSIGLGFLLGIIGAGFGVVLEQVIIRHFRRRTLIAALTTEIEENARRLEAAEQTGALSAPIKSSAWDAAREVELPTTLRDDLVDAYAAGERMNRGIDLVDTFVGGSSTVAPDQQMLAVHQTGQMAAAPLARANEALHAFRRARSALKSQ